MLRFIRFVGLMSAIASIQLSHDNSSLCARFGELRLMGIAVLLPVVLAWYGVVVGQHELLLRFLLGLQAGVIGWIAAALAGYAGARILRDLPYCPLRRRDVLQVGQLLTYVGFVAVSWRVII